MWCSFRSRYPLSFLLLVVSLKVTRVEGAQCYGINGQKSSGTQCNSSATGLGSSHSSCCDETRQEACLSSGLCFATQRGDNHTFWSQGCTDPTGMDPACPSYCGRSSQFISMPIQASYTMQFCGNGAWCCCFDNLGMACDQKECCARNFTLSRGLGTVTRQFDNTGITNLLNGGSIQPNTNTDTTSSLMPGGTSTNMPPWMRLIPIIVSGLLGSLFLATIVALGFSCTQNRRLKRQVETLQNNLNVNLGITQKLRSYSLSRASAVSPLSSARPSASAPPPPPIITTTSSDSLSRADGGGSGYFPSPLGVSPLGMPSPAALGPRGAEDIPPHTPNVIPWQESYNDEMVRTPRTPITAAYHHHLSMVNQALGPSTVRSAAGTGLAVPVPPEPPQQQSQLQSQNPYGYAMPSPAAAAGRRPSWPIRGTGTGTARYTAGGYFTEGHGLPPGYGVGDTTISELPVEKGHR
ncbi:hypothetical protein QBC35DRAFT_472277 [Podospora australis]|uniref:Uncharacterized protein n=1 Tax=Podospora australis TaxID=1536484 RepID=A0AAN6X0E0_9PEZI|nr:hypothetical protein QBC35DRAFT_472277 [Podospora australis]